MAFKEKIGEAFVWKGDHFELTKEFYNKHRLEFPKLTGSRFPTALGENGYCTPLKLWCEMVGIFDEYVDPIYSRTGNKYEPFIRDEAEKKLGYKFISYKSFDEGGDVFRDEHDIFGGIPDGEPINDKGDIDYSNDKRMIEIKTSAVDTFKRKLNKDGKWCVEKDDNKMPIVKPGGEGKGLEKWYKNNELVIPLYYLDQLNLYLYLRKETKGIFAVLLLKPEDYINLDKIDLSNKQIKYQEVELDRTSFEQKAAAGIEWYKSFIVTGVSPKMTKDDIKWLTDEGILK